MIKKKCNSIDGKHMKKYIILFCAAFCIATTLSGQEKKHAIGLRYGILSQSNIELSYQYYLNKTSRMQFGLGTAEYALQASAVYQKTAELSAIIPGLKIYGGAGVIAGFHSSKTGVGVAAQGGLEYNFRIPFQVSLDYRPKIYWPGDNFYFDDFCVSLRYRF
jgi:hypothetical protein